MTAHCSLFRQLVTVVAVAAWGSAPASLRAADSAPATGVVGYLSLDDTLAIVTPAGEELAADFTRHSQAFTDDLRHVHANEPRYVKGRFGAGVVVEPGFETKEKHACRNYLPPDIAEIGPSADGALPFKALGDAEVRMAEAESGRHVGTSNPVLEGTRSLLVACPAAGGGVETGRPVSIVEGAYTVSAFVRSDDATEDDQLLVELTGPGGEPFASAPVSLTGVWARVELNAEVGRFTRDKAKQKRRGVVLRFRATRAGQSFRLDGLVLEMRGGYSYAGTGSASSWLPGNGYRASETLSLEALKHSFRGARGSIAFWARTRGSRQAWRTLFEIAGTDRWHPRLQLKLRPDTRLSLGPSTGKPAEAVANVDIQPESWHHYAVVWHETGACMFLDGAKVGGITGVDTPLHPTIRLGSAGPNAAANAVIDEAVVYDRPLKDDEVSRLAARSEPLSSMLAPAVTIRPALFLRTIAHTSEPQSWLCDVRNHTGNDLRDVRIVLQIGEHLRLRHDLARLAAGAAAPVCFRFVADLDVGTYPLQVTALSGDQARAVFRRDVDITPMAEPFENLQVSPWGWNADRELGLTFGGGDIEDAMRRGLYWAPLHHYLGYPRTIDGEDVRHGMDDEPGLADFTSPYMAAQVAREGEHMARRFAAIPSMRGITLSSEVQWIWHHDFSPDRAEWVEKQFGLDLTTWRYPPEKGGVDAYQTPFGRLKPSVAGITLPQNRVIPVSEPLYAYHRWFHGPEAPTEAYLNQELSDAIHRLRPDVLTIQEPILRRPAVRAFERVSIAQEWFYYEDPMSAVMVQERLNAAVRGTRLRPTGMPQFLFKSGRAAPYNAIATADMYHEAVWLCALQPIRMFTYWNLNVVPDAGFENYYNRCMTKPQIDELFGTPTPTWEQAKEALAADPTLARKLMPWTPELAATFRRFHTQEVGPLGGLIPRWRNRPRRIAILRSFASQLYREERWPRTTWLEACAVHCGMPFDVLYDSDFEADAGVLGSYHLIVVSRTVCLTQPAFAALAAFAKRGGTIVVDAQTLVDLPGAVKLESTESDAGFAEALRMAEEEAMQRFESVEAPGYVEAMTQVASESRLPNRVEPTFLAVVEENVVPEARSLTPNTWLNLLEAEGANYIGVVNDLRVRGPMVGHFGKVRETGVPQEAVVEFTPSLGTVVYDLLAMQAVPVEGAGKSRTLRLGLPAGGAHVLMLLPRSLGALEVLSDVVVSQWGDHRGRSVRVRAELLDDGGGKAAGLVPATITITRPDGTCSDYSRHTVFERGRLTYTFPLPCNGPAGTWRVRVLERASGQTEEVSLKL